MKKSRDRAGAPTDGPDGMAQDAASQPPGERARLLDEVRGLDLTSLGGWLSEDDLRRLAGNVADAQPGAAADADDGSAPRERGGGTRRRRAPR
jgi:hypothetical protein